MCIVLLLNCVLNDCFEVEKIQEVRQFNLNSLHATGLYIDYMNNSLVKKEKEKKREKGSYRTGVRRGVKDVYCIIIELCIE